MTEKETPIVYENEVIAVMQSAIGQVERENKQLRKDLAEARRWALVELQTRVDELFEELRGWA